MKEHRTTRLRLTRYCTTCNWYNMYV